MPRNLILAYAATWTVHGLYILFLIRRFRGLRRK
jgi:CcmD family protein